MFVIPTRNINTQFDKKILHSYNGYGCMKRLNRDCFQASFGKQRLINFNPKEQEQFKKLKSSKNLTLSPVSYVIDILNDYFDKKISDSDFSQRMIRETKEAQFIFSQMPPSEIHSNKVLFEKEFKFADEIGRSALAGKKGDDLKISINNAIYKYNQK